MLTRGTTSTNDVCHLYTDSSSGMAVINIWGIKVKKLSRTVFSLRYQVLIVTAPAWPCTGRRGLHDEWLHDMIVKPADVQHTLQSLSRSLSDSFPPKWRTGSSDRGESQSLVCGDKNWDSRSWPVWETHTHTQIESFCFLWSAADSGRAQFIKLSYLQLRGVISVSFLGHWRCSEMSSFTLRTQVSPLMEKAATAPIRPPCTANTHPLLELEQSSRIHMTSATLCTPSPRRGQRETRKDCFLIASKRKMGEGFWNI